MSAISFTLSYDGSKAKEHQIDFYDAAQALIGFQRSLALTIHAVLNDEVITQAPSLKGAEILAAPSETGSWKTKGIVILALGGIYQLGTAPPETPIGHLMRSAYDYVISQSLGFHVDFSKTLGQQYNNLPRKTSKQIPQISQSRLDAVIEKVDISVSQMHRPIVYSGTATSATISSQLAGQNYNNSKTLDAETNEYVLFTEESQIPLSFMGKISSYNVNTFKGRVYVESEMRPIPFELSDFCRTLKDIKRITRNLDSNATNDSGNNFLNFHALTRKSRTGMLKGLLIVEIKR